MIKVNKDTSVKKEENLNETERKKEEHDEAEAKKTIESKVSTAELDLKEQSWKTIHSLMETKPLYWIQGHIDSYNSFFSHQIRETLLKTNPICFQNEDKLETRIYLGGKNADKIYFGKPVIYDDNKATYMYPNLAKLRGMTYSSLVHVDVVIETDLIKKDTSDQNKEKTDSNDEFVLEKIFLFELPIMVNSKLCIFHNLDQKVKEYMGQSSTSLGGTFVINGQNNYIPLTTQWLHNEVIVMSGEKSYICFSKDNYLYVNKRLPNEEFTNGQYEIMLPKFRNPIPLFIFLRALGFHSDKEMVTACGQGNSFFYDQFVPSVHDSGRIFSQELAIAFLSSQWIQCNDTKEKDMQNFLEHDFFPSLKSDQKAKGYMLAYMVYSMLQVEHGFQMADTEESLLKKMVVTPGAKLLELFQQSCFHEKKRIQEKTKEMYYNHRGQCAFSQEEIQNKNATANKINQNNFAFIMELYAKEILKDNIIAKNFQNICMFGNETIFKMTNTQDDTIVVLSLLREISKFQKVHGSFFGYLDPFCESQMAVGCFISAPVKDHQILMWLKENTCLLKTMSTQVSRVFFNGMWVGSVNDGLELVTEMKKLKLNGIFSPFVSIYFDFSKNEVHIDSRPGRYMRPVYNMAYKNASKTQETKDFWTKAICGTREKHEEAKWSPDSGKVYSKAKLYPDEHSSRLHLSLGFIDLICPEEENSSLLIATSVSDIENNKLNKYTNIELEPSLTLGLSTVLSNFPDHGSLSSNKLIESRFCSASMNAYFCQHPLLKSRYSDYLLDGQMDKGTNLIVAVMAYDGYNANKGVLINKGSLQRGLFFGGRKMEYEAFDTDKTEFTNPLKHDVVVNIESNVNYSFLDDDGFLKDNTIIPMNNKVALIGRTLNTGAFVEDASVFNDTVDSYAFVNKTLVSSSSKGDFVAKTFLTVDERAKMGSVLMPRGGHNGSICELVQEKDLPFSQHGVVPDIIIHPETLICNVNQIMEILFGQVGSLYGSHVDCTAFQLNGSQFEFFGSLLMKHGFASTGNHIFYSGLTGETFESNIFMGPSYYSMKEPNFSMIRDLKGEDVDEMFDLTLLSLGLSSTLSNFLSREDVYLAICNKTGTIAVYNSSRNIFFSLYVDGPLLFHTKPNGDLNVVNVSRFGKSFSLVKVPSTFLSLIQELQALNIQMRIITDDNFDQLLSMSFSHNIHKLLNSSKNKGSEDLIVSFVKKMKLALTNSKILEVPEEEKDDNERNEEDLKPLTVESSENNESDVKIVLNEDIVKEETQDGKEKETEKEKDELFVSTPLIKKTINESTTAENILKTAEESKQDKTEEKKESNGTETSSSMVTKKTVSFEKEPSTTTSSSSGNVKKISM